ncbi:hypothetical protein VTL71DRAFT_11048 [Oculimacula yallundae]|uniref:Uncharacterized protein n=1 Tax=Oculimacula yallundae TaxID=86028 RepID=A0ABR4CV78_9HELO
MKDWPEVLPRYTLNFHARQHLAALHNTPLRPTSLKSQGQPESETRVTVQAGRRGHTAIPSSAFSAIRAWRLEPPDSSTGKGKQETSFSQPRNLLQTRSQLGDASIQHQSLLRGAEYQRH